MLVNVRSLVSASRLTLEIKKQEIEIEGVNFVTKNKKPAEIKSKSIKKNESITD